MVEVADLTGDFFAAAGRQRACRAFLPDHLPEDVVTKILAAATMAPSAENSQPWVFVVVRDPAGRAEIARLTEAAWSGGARAYSQGRLDPALLADVERGATGGIAAAPVLVVVGADLNRCHRATIGSSLFPAIQNLLLAATACGLGSALTTLSTGDAAGLSAAVGFPEHVVPVAVVPLGRPERSLGPPRREPVETKAHDGRYGTPWPSRP